MKRLVSLSFLTAVLAACAGDRAPTPPRAGPTGQIFDGAHDINGVRGNSHFFFLPPIGAVPIPRGEPNRLLAPTVEVCQLGRTGCALDGSGNPIVVARFTPTEGLGGETIDLVPGDGHYVVNWHTSLSALDPAKNYRIRVLIPKTALSAVELGFVDVDVARNLGEFAGVDRSQFLPLLNGRTLPIPFLIEIGALCETSQFSCATTPVDQAGGTFTTDDRLAGVIIPENSLPPGVDRVDLTIELIPEVQFEPGNGPLPTDLQQFPFFFHYTTDPKVTFARPVLVGVCQVTDRESRFYPPDELHDRLQLAHPSPADPKTLEVLTRLPAPDFLSCFGQTEGGAPAGGDLAVRGLRRLLRALAPRSLFAASSTGHGGLGGSTQSFSPFGAVVPSASPPPDPDP